MYDPEWVDTQLDGIVSLGMNTVRFFLDMCMECTTTNSGIRPEYLDNLADLLTRLEAHGLVALPTSNDVPDPGFSNRLPCCEPFGGYRNSLYLAPEGNKLQSNIGPSSLKVSRSEGRQLITSSDGSWRTNSSICAMFPDLDNDGFGYHCRR